MCIAAVSSVQKPMSEALDEQYFRRVEQHFGQRRGGPLVLSPKDWRLLETWHEKGIPLSVVLRGINNAFDRFLASGPRPDRINSLRYCEQEIEAAWELHRDAQGRLASTEDDAGDSGSAAASRHLGEVAEACRKRSTDHPERVAECLIKAANELDALAERAVKDSLDARTVDAEATAIETRLRRGLDDTADPEAGSGQAASAPVVQLPPFSPYEV